MAAIQRSRISSSVAGGFAAAVCAALLVGGTGGYIMRALTSHEASAGQAAVSSLADEDLTQSDLTRAQPPAIAPGYEYLPLSDLTRAQPPVELPAWVQKYMSTAPVQQFKVDEFIENLSYDRPVSTGDAVDGPLQFRP